MAGRGGPIRSRRRALLAGLAVCAAIALLLVAFRHQIASYLSLRRVNAYPLYVMHLYGDYGLDEFLHRCIEPGRPAPQTADGEVPPGACSVFAAQTPDGSRILGRNFDWHNRASLLLFTHPPEGYASASMVDLAYLLDDAGALSLSERLRLSDAVYWPFDGMNEAGLAVGMMAVPEGRDGQDPSRTTIGSLHAIRLMLDRAASVDEAVALLAQYNIDFQGGPPLHYLLADATGASAVVEFIDGEMSVLPGETTWQVATNFLLRGLRPDAARGLCPRYAKAFDTLAQAEGTLSEARAMSLLEQVSQPSTMWSVTYHLGSGEIQVSTGRDYEDVQTFSLPLRGWQK